ncbi:MAG TPA: aldolase [Phycisphaerae bacterium]|nr:aldolase [Phycisphaerae bacterium]
MEMRPSRVLNKMRAGGVAICAKTNLADPRVIEIIGRAGFDCAWTDMEHVPNTLHDVENQIRAAKMHDMDTLVRVRRGSYSNMILPLEMDATGIMVPHIMSAADAKQVVYYTRFHPVGRRPWDGGNSDGGFCMIPPEIYKQQANERRFVIVQIEDPEPLDSLDEIAEIEGIDMLFFGPGDFSQGIGHPGEVDHPKVQETKKRVAKVAREHGKFAGTMGTPDNVQSLLDMGYQFVNVHADVVLLSHGFHAAAEAVRKSGFLD